MKELPDFQYKSYLGSDYTRCGDGALRCFRATKCARAEFPKEAYRISIAAFYEANGKDCQMFIQKGQA